MSGRLEKQIRSPSSSIMTGPGIADPRRQKSGRCRRSQSRHLSPRLLDGPDGWRRRSGCDRGLYRPGPRRECSKSDRRPRSSPKFDPPPNLTTIMLAEHVAAQLDMTNDSRDIEPSCRPPICWACHCSWDAGLRSEPIPCSDMGCGRGRLEVLFASPHKPTVPRGGRRGRDREERDAACSAPQLRDPPARARHRNPQNPGALGSRQITPTSKNMIL